MSRVNLDFSAPGARPGALSWLLLGLGLLAIAAAGFSWRTADALAREARTALAAVSPVAASKPGAREKAAAKHVDPVAQAREREESAARHALELPWTRLLATLQETQPDQIAFLQIEADGRRGDFQLTAEAKSYQAMLDYYRMLQGEPGFRAVSLTRHELHEIDGMQGVNFSLRGDWTEKPAAPPSGEGRRP